MDPVVQQIKDRINIADVVGTYVTLRRAGKSLVGRCPFHKERTPSFHVSPERGTYKCFGCGEGGDVFSFIQKMDGTDFPTVLKQLAEKAGVKLENRKFKTATPEEKEKEERLRDVCEATVAFFEAELKKRKDVLDYLHTRGVKDETITHWRLGYAPAVWESLVQHLVAAGHKKDDIVDAGFAVRSEKKQGEIFDRFRGRIMFPIFDLAGQPIAVSGRFFEKVPGAKDDTEPAKYVNSPETVLFKKSRTLYGLHAARGAIRKLDCILLVEGQFDLILSHQSGLPFAVAISGTALTEEHLMLLGRLSKRLVLALDADEAGIRAGLKSTLMALREGFEVKVPLLTGGKDPADLARENPELLKAAIRTAKPAVEYFLDVLRPRARDAGAYTKLVQMLILPLVRATTSSIEREQLVHLVAGRLMVSESAILHELAKIKDTQNQGGAEFGSSEVHQSGGESVLTPVQKKAGMLLSKFGRESVIGEKIAALLSAEDLQTLETALLGHEEEMRFKFDSEIGEHSEEMIAQEMLAELERHIGKTRFKMKFL